MRRTDDDLDVPMIMHVQETRLQAITGHLCLCAPVFGHPRVPPKSTATDRSAGVIYSYYPDWIDSLRRVERLDFDILAPGHRAMGTRQDVVDHRRYHEDLYNAVVAAVGAGQSLDEMKASITLDEYKDWGSFGNWRELNIEEVYLRVVL